VQIKFGMATACAEVGSHAKSGDENMAMQRKPNIDIQNEDCDMN